MFFEKNIYLIAIGSNVGDAIETFGKCIDNIKKLKIGKVYSCSKPMCSYFIRASGNKQYEDMESVCTNSTFVLLSNLEPVKMLTELKLVEKLAGRKKSVKWGDRTLDLDIIFLWRKGLHGYKRSFFSNWSLTIPHKLCHERFFVIRPSIISIANFARRNKLPYLNNNFKHYLCSRERLIAEAA